MNAPYHTKALPVGTTLREWRLEEILGAGGFGIVYRGRGTYFNELVAIKEYFPSAISDRIDGETVKPTDSSSEEIYDLGLQKFVEEAKILWNLSRPERHPNIVSVRSLFEIHGTAYMVMDFESGTSLSQMLREGRRFDEASLMGLLRPIALGLARAHEAGVVHRDIKPANILVDESGRPVLIDFGSARFDAGQATSTKVTFYTPPYAALEQYVRTYPQGGWTDIYALGVVAYQCITGEKPPEVLERLHGGLGEPLSAKEWPGYSRAFTRAIDAAMGIRPNERPQSIADWLKLFDAPEDEAPSPAPVAADEDDRTMIVMRPSAPAAGAPAPARPQLKPTIAAAAPIASAPAAVDLKPAPAAAASSPARPVAPGEASPREVAKKKPPLALIGAGAAVVVLAGAGAAVMTMTAKPGPAGPASSAPASAPVAARNAPAAAPAAGPSVSAVANISPAAQALVAAARQADRPSGELAVLNDAAGKIDALTRQLPGLTAHGPAGQVQALVGQINAAGARMAQDEARALGAGVRGQVREAEAVLGKAAVVEGSDAAQALHGLVEARARLEADIAAVSKAAGPAAALAAAAAAIPEAEAFARAYKTAQAAYVPVEQARLASLVNVTGSMSAAIVNDASRPKPWFLAPKAVREAYKALQADAAQAKSHDAELASLGQIAKSASDVKTVSAAISRATALKAQITSLYASASASAAVK